MREELMVMIERWRFRMGVIRAQAGPLTRASHMLSLPLQASHNPSPSSF